MVAYTAVKTALDPTPRQEKLMWSNAGANRYAFNLLLRHVKHQLTMHEKHIDWSMREMREWWHEWRDEFAPWWDENSKEAYNSAFEALALGLKNMYESRNGKRKGARVCFPKPKSKRSSTPRFAYTTGHKLIKDDPKAIWLPRIGRVHCMENITAMVDGRHITRVTITYKAGKWYAALTLVQDDAHSNKFKVKRASSKPRRIVGIDLGVKTLATLSDGTVFENPHTYKKYKSKLRQAQKTLSRRDKDANDGHGSKGYQKALARLRRVNARITALRADYTNKITTYLVNHYDEISIEDLNTSGMTHNHNLAASILDANFSEFRRQLEYKTARTDTILHIISRWEPSSKRCSNCGMVKAKLSLSDRVYECEYCGLIMDRDLNAAINIMVAGSAPETVNARGGDVSQELGNLAPAVLDETRTKQANSCESWSCTEQSVHAG